MLIKMLFKQLLYIYIDRESLNVPGGSSRRAIFFSFLTSFIISPLFSLGSKWLFCVFMYSHFCVYEY